MSMRCKVNNIITPEKVHSMTPQEEAMELEEYMKEEVDIEAEEEFEEPLAEEEDRSSVITMDNRVTLHETVRWSHVFIVKLPIMLLKTAQYY